MRALSLASGLNPNYVGDMMDGAQPTVKKFLAICDALGISPIEILYGEVLTQEVRELASRPEVIKLLRDPDGVEFVTYYSKVSEKDQKRIRDFLRPDDLEEAANDEVSLQPLSDQSK